MIVTNSVLWVWPRFTPPRWRWFDKTRVLLLFEWLLFSWNWITWIESLVNRVSFELGKRWINREMPSKFRQDCLKARELSTWVDEFRCRLWFRVCLGSGLSTRVKEFPTSVDCFGWLWRGNSRPYVDEFPTSFVCGPPVLRDSRISDLVSRRSSEVNSVPLPRQLKFDGFGSVCLV